MWVSSPDLGQTHFWVLHLSYIVQGWTFTGMLRQRNVIHAEESYACTLLDLFDTDSVSWFASFVIPFSPSYPAVGGGISPQSRCLDTLTWYLRNPAVAGIDGIWPHAGFIVNLFSVFFSWFTDQLCRVSVCEFQCELRHINISDITLSVSELLIFQRYLTFKITMKISIKSPQNDHFQVWNTG